MTQPVTIRDVQVITTQPSGQRLVIVKVITSEPGLYGLGCATFTQRFHAVVAALEGHLKAFVLGRDVSRIEEIWQMAMVNGYWRNGPVLNNAISGIDQALWDIKGKMAGMPVYDLLGGKCREAAAVYTHADGREPQEVEDNVRKFMAEGYRYIRIQMGGYGGRGAALAKPDGAPDGAYFDPRGYMRNMLRMMAHVRGAVGEEVELLHDIHERLSPIDAVQFAKDVEQFRLFFLEDSLAPEDIEWFRMMRAQCATPLAMGELFNSPHEWLPLINDRLIDFIRMHVSQMGGITPARHVAATGEYVRRAHGVARPRRHLARRPRGQSAPGPLGAEFRHPGMVPLQRAGLRDVPRPARRAQRLYVPERQARPGDRHRREAGGEVSVRGLGGGLDADPSAGWQPGAAVR